MRKQSSGRVDANFYVYPGKVLRFSPQSGAAVFVESFQFSGRSGQPARSRTAHRTPSAMASVNQRPWVVHGHRRLSLVDGEVFRTRRWGSRGATQPQLQNSGSVAAMWPGDRARCRAPTPSNQAVLNSAQDYATGGLVPCALRVVLVSRWPCRNWGAGVFRLQSGEIRAASHQRRLRC